MVVAGGLHTPMLDAVALQITNIWAKPPPVAIA